MKSVIKNGTVLDPVTGQSQNKDIFIEAGRFVEASIASPEKTIDATGLVVLPGLIDAHCHLREPGQEYKEDIASGTRSAAKGGFTTVACMPNTTPVCDNAAIVKFILEQAKTKGLARVLPIGAATKGQEGHMLAEIGLMAEAGIVAVSDDGQPVSSADMMKKALLYAAQFSLPLISHCEDKSLAAGGHVNEGAISARLGLKGIPTVAESAMVARDILLAEYLDLPIHIAHVSAAASVELIRQAKKRNVKVTCETCPHYFTLSDEACLGFDTRTKMNPPLRTPQDVAAIIAGLADDTIDLIATDHAPHHADEKDVEFERAPNGIVGLESALALGYTRLVRPGHLTLADLIAKMTVQPAKLLGQPLGSFATGHSADVILVDFEHDFVFCAQDMASKARNTPFDNMTLRGEVRTTLYEGRIVYEKLR